MEKFKSLLSLTLGMCLSTITFKIFNDAIFVEKPAISVETIAKSMTEPVIEPAVASEKKGHDIYQEVVMREPNRLDLWERLANLEIQQKRYENAIEALKNSINLQVKDVGNLDLKNKKLYAQLSDAAPEIMADAKSPVKTTALVPEEGIMAEEEKKWDQAIYIYREVIAKDPNRPDLWKRIGDIENTQKKYQNAIEAFKNAISLRPKDAALYVSLSETYAVINQAEEALAAINQALLLDPTNVDYLDRRVVLANWLGQYDQLEDSYKRLLTIAPNHQLACAGLQNIANEKANNKLNTDVAAAKVTANEKPSTPAAVIETLETKTVDIQTPTPIITPNTTPAMTEKPLISPPAVVETKKSDSTAVNPDEDTFDENSNTAETNRSGNMCIVNNRSKKISTLNKTIKLKQSPDATYAAQAKKYAEEKRYEEALVHIDLALAKEPNNIDYLKSQADIAMQDKNYVLAKNSYSKILEIKPDDKEGLLGIANLELTRDNQDVAAIAYQKYLSLYPDSKTAWLDYAKLQSWRGNYVAAFDAIKQYKNRYGETYEYLSVKARLFEMSGYPEHALSLVKDLLVKSPNDYEALFTEAGALEGHREPNEAIEALSQIESKFPRNSDNAYLRDAILIPKRSTFSLDGYFCHDSDNIKILSSGMHGQYFITPETSMIYGFKQENLSAIIGSGLDTIDGYGTTWDRAQWIGLTHQICPELSVSGLGGLGEIKKNSSFFRYNFNVIANPNDYMQIIFEKGQDIFAFSPRSVSLRTLQRYNRASIKLQPYVQKYLEIGAEYDHFSDKNRLKGLTLYPHATVFASQYLDIELGPYMNWQQYALQDPNNGYYDPRSSQMYQALSHFTIKQNDNINYVLTLGLGRQKDETMLKPGFAGDIALRAIYGIYADWYLNIQASAAARDSNSLLENTGNKYRIYTIEALLTKRF